MYLLCWKIVFVYYTNFKYNVHRYQTLIINKDEGRQIVSYNNNLEILFLQKADLAAAFLPVIREGQQFLQYSRNLDNGEWVVLMKRPKESAQGSGLLAPFTFDVWMLILVSLIAVGPSIYLIIYLRYKLCPIDEKNKVFPLPQCVWFVYGALLKQGSTLSPISGK